MSTEDELYRAVLEGPALDGPRRRYAARMIASSKGPMVQDAEPIDAILKKLKEDEDPGVALASASACAMAATCSGVALDNSMVTSLTRITAATSAPNTVAGYERQCRRVCFGACEPPGPVLDSFRLQAVTPREHSGRLSASLPCLDHCAALGLAPVLRGCW